MPRLFDTYIMVDWSAASTPRTGRDSIWIAELNAQTRRIRFQNPNTRSSAGRILERRLHNLTDNGHRVLLGFDFSLGYPTGTARALGLGGTPWETMHAYLADIICDSGDNANNRFAVAASMNTRISNRSAPFWGVTSKRYVTDTLSAKKPERMGLSEFRIVERYLRNQKLGAPKSVWQLAYIGSVGSQSLMGIPTVDALRRKFLKARLWPFETGFRAITSKDLEDTQIVVAEIYPSLVEATPKPQEPLDKAQVRAIARHYCEMDESGNLGAAFAPPKELKAADLSIINAEEGWILGISPINIGNSAS